MKFWKLISVWNWSPGSLISLKMKNISRAELMLVKAAMLPGLFSGWVFGQWVPRDSELSHAEIHYPGRMELLLVRKQQVSEGPVDENSGILMSRSAAKI